MLYIQLKIKTMKTKATKELTVLTIKTFYDSKRFVWNSKRRFNTSMQFKLA